jgi:hypothetical protein
MSAVLVDFLVPVDHWLEPALDSLNDAVDQELVVVGQQSCSLLRFHLQRSAQSVQDEFERAFGLTWLAIAVHLHDVDSVLYCFLLGWLIPAIRQLLLHCRRTCFIILSIFSLFEILK